MKTPFGVKKVGMRGEKRTQTMQISSSIDQDVLITRLEQSSLIQM